jgi:hypothetical protein
MRTLPIIEINASAGCQAGQIASPYLTAVTIEERLDRIEAMLCVLVEQSTVREWYTTEQFAQLVGKSEFTVREYCRRGRIKAEKRRSGRGAYPAWVISHEELQRFQREGLLPLRLDVIRTSG